MVDQSVSHLMIIRQHLEVIKSLFTYGMLKQDNQKSNQIIIFQSTLYASLPMVILQHLLVRANTFWLLDVKKVKLKQLIMFLS
ncbi:unnamed protein product [Paramecium sonneborni]|uniref:Uncharacterized protein n=1 Tax=Paramecium sonneborni TaxID=65129 RepID=A0A8S1MJ73_9CILI|nr:unnamed protein product [Paramecium sonneborni]